MHVSCPRSRRLDQHAQIEKRESRAGQALPRGGRLLTISLPSLGSARVGARYIVPFRRSLHSAKYLTRRRVGVSWSYPPRLGTGRPPMETALPSQSQDFGKSPSGPLREFLTDAILFWEPRRLIYNLVLTVVVVILLV